MMARLLEVTGTESGLPRWLSLLDLRVDDHPDPMRSWNG